MGPLKLITTSTEFGITPLKDHLNYPDIKSTLANVVRPVNIVKNLFVVGSVYLIYKTVKIYIKRRRFRHIPGPGTKG